MKRCGWLLGIALLLAACSDDSEGPQADGGAPDRGADLQAPPPDSGADQAQQADAAPDLGRDSAPLPDGPQSFVLRNLDSVGEAILLKPSAGEEGHLCASRLTPPAYPAVIEQISYDLGHHDAPNAQGITCNAGLAHQVELYISTANAPPAEPAAPRVLEIPAQDPATINPELGRQVKATVAPPLTLQQGEQLFVAIRFVGSATEPLCVLMGLDPSYEGDRNFWSNAAEPPYSWVQLDSFGLTGTILARAKGYVAQ